MFASFLPDSCLVFSEQGPNLTRAAVEELQDRARDKRF